MVIQIQCKENHDMENNNFEPQNEQQQYGQAGQAPQQPYSAPQQPYAAPMPPQDKANVGLAILSYLIPLVGIIIYFTQKNSKPKNAKTCGKCALASIIINVVLSVIIYAVAGAALFSATDDTAYTVLMTTNHMNLKKMKHRPAQRRKAEPLPMKSTPSLKRSLTIMKVLWMNILPLWKNIPNLITAQK